MELGKKLWGSVVFASKFGVFLTLSYALILHSKSPLVPYSHSDLTESPLSPSLSPSLQRDIANVPHSLQPASPQPLTHFILILILILVLRRCGQCEAGLPQHTSLASTLSSASGISSNDSQSWSHAFNSTSCYLIFLIIYTSPFSR